MKTISLHTIKEHRFVVTPADVASFNEKMVHAVCATFALAREIEWTTRQFVLEMIDPDEEGVGTYLSIDHKSPAFAGEEIIFTAKIDQLNNHELICSYEAIVKGRLIAVGKTGQKILKREKINRIFSQGSRS
jgi:fluoroacetyl-CoA thioesterase